MTPDLDPARCYLRASKPIPPPAPPVGQMRREGLERFHIDAGVVTLTYPFRMTCDDADYFEDRLMLTIRAVKRRALPNSEGMDGDGI